RGTTRAQPGARPLVVTSVTRAVGLGPTIDPSFVADDLRGGRARAAAPGRPARWRPPPGPGTDPLMPGSTARPRTPTARACWARRARCRTARRAAGLTPAQRT